MSKVYDIYDIATGKKKLYTLADLERIGEELPTKCIQHIERNPESLRAQKDLTELLSISLTVWNGGPKGKITEIPIEEYAAEFYIHMVKYLQRFDRNKGCWVSRVKYIRLDTIKAFLRPIMRDKAIKDAVSSEIESFLHENPEFRTDIGTRVIDCE